MPGSTPEALNPESLGGAGTTSTTDSGAMPPPANGSTTTGASNSEQTSTRPGNSPKESSQTGLPGGTEPLPPGGNSAISGSTSTTPSTTNSEIGEEKGNYKRKLEETFNADKEAMGNCAPHFQKKLLDAKISGSMNSITTDGKTSMAFKITGNKNKLDINYKNQGNTEVKSTFEGLCIFVAGNQSKVVVSVKDVLLKRIVVVARGNKAKVEVKVEGSGDVSEIVFDGKGNSPSLKVSAPATYPCKDRIKTIGKESGTCKVTP